MDYNDRFDTTRKEFETALSEVTDGLNVAEPLISAMRYSLFTGGKRFRPVMLLEACRAFSGGVSRAAMLMACAVESLHTYSLVHDDLPCMDDDDFRRGQPTSHKKFGEDMAVLAGDALQNLAFELAFEAVASAGYTRRAAEAGRFFASLTGGSGLIGGQVADLHFALDPTLAELKKVYRHKTCDLIIAAVVAGAILGGADERSVRAMGRYAYHFGFAFQLADDLIDGDSEEGCSILRVTGADEARLMLREHTLKAKSALKEVKADLGFFEYFAELSGKRAE